MVERVTVAPNQGEVNLQPMHTYVVNLARSTDRRAHMVTQLARTDIAYEFVDAVEGRDLDLTDTTMFDTTIVGTPTFRPGAAGCALSHLEVYRRVCDLGVEVALVLEDDVVLPADLRPLVDEVARHMGEAEVVLLNFHSTTPCRVRRRGSFALPAARLLVDVVDEHQPSSTGAYLITQEACRRMLSTALPLRAQPDDWGFYHAGGAINRVRCVVPMPVANSGSVRSTIDYYLPGSFQARFREAVTNARVPVLDQVLALKRKRNFRRWGWSGQTEFVDSPS